MHDQKSPVTLHALAVRRWHQLQDPDPRSQLYAEADVEPPSARIRSAPPGGARQANWVDTLRRYEQFWNETGSAPRENTRNRSTLPAVERRLGEWARYQRRFQDGLCRYQVLRLDVSPAFVWDMQGDRWDQNYERCLQVISRIGELPQLTSGDAEQFVSARWLNRQLRLIQSGLLAERRSALIAKLLGASHLS